MHKKSNPTLIGIFVILALALGIGMIMLLGGREMFSKRAKYVLYFDGSLKGLEAGAPVTFHGVKIGEVTDINVIIDGEKDQMTVPVVIEIFRDSMIFKNVAYKELNNPEKMCRKMIDKGIRAQLQLQSLVTGKLQIELAFLPQTEGRMLGHSGPAMELPTIPTEFEILQEELKDIPIKQIMADLSNILKTLNKIVNSPDLAPILSNLRQSTESLNKLLANVDSRVVGLSNNGTTVMSNINALLDRLNKQVTRLADDAKVTLAEYKKVASNADEQIGNLAGTAESTLGEYQKLAKNADKQLQNVGGDLATTASALRKTFRNAEVAMVDVRNVLTSVNGIVGKQSVLRDKLHNTLDVINKTAFSLKELADYLNRYPESLIRGKKGE
jgi:paraquat-inducible protein B